MSSMGGCYTLRYIGNAPLPKFNPGFSVLQKPLHDLYVSYLTPKGLRQPLASRLALTDRGIIVTIQGNDSFYSMRDVLLCEAVHWVRVQTKDKKFLSAFEPINPDRHRGKDGLFSKLDGQYKYLTKLNHEPILACVLRRTSGPKTIDVHAFVCASEAQVFDIVASITLVQEQFQSQEPFQEVPGSVRIPAGSSAGHLGNANGFRSQRQVKSSIQRGEGEITLEELVRLADMALADPPMRSNAATAPTNEAPPFRMGESWGAKENPLGVRRSKTFNEGQKRNGAAESRAADQARHQNNVRLEPQGPPEASRGGAGGGGGGGAVPWKQLQDVRYYENISVPAVNGQQRTYENLSVPGLIPADNFGQEHPSPVAHPRLNQQQQQPQQQLDDRDVVGMNGQQQQLMMMIADQQRRNSRPPESLRMVIAESRMANKRGSVLPGNDFCLSSSAFDISSAGDPRAPAIVDIHFDHDQQPIQSSSSPKPIAMVQPRKVSGVKVLPEPGIEGFQLHKVSKQHGKGLEEPRKEQYERGDAGNRNFTRSMYELNNNAVVAKPTTPQARPKFTSPDPDPVRRVTTAESATPQARPKFTSPDPDPVRRVTAAESATPQARPKFTSPDPDPVRIVTTAESATPQARPKFTSPDPDPVRRATTAELEPARKSSNPDVLNRDGRENKAAEKPAGERGKKDAEIEAFAMNIDFYRPPTNTLSPHGTNFESALGYFP